ncbi:unnamed protein product [Eruca vesicaria subsp. sativa]|uniref:TIR domain-containing protein n=1 Tax=Eruca vesicaria subsp. sativa TaxID=29727 RepID=A0ABC8IW33_ERUVS|nr:unnamed protein product [Eruca vesicaria subsp. sativa]
MASSSATRPQVFINFRGPDLRKGIVSFLVHELTRENINVFIDDQEERGQHLSTLFRRIEESKLALAIFSEKYSESKWCLDELAKIYECVKDNKLKVIPVFYKIPVDSVTHLTGHFGDQYRKLKNEYKLKEPERVKSWKEALMSIPKYFAMPLSAASGTSDKDFVDKIVKEVQRTLKAVKGQPEAVQERQQPEAVQIRQQPEAVQIRQPIVNRQSCMYSLENLTISSSCKASYWTIVSISESPNEESSKVAKMRECWYLDFRGTVDTTKLASGTRYEVVFVVKVEDTMRRWDSPAMVRLMVPDNELQERKLQFVDLERNEWIEIQAGVFIAQPHKVQTEFKLYQYEPILMTGLILKGAIIRPVE